MVAKVKAKKPSSPGGAITEAGNIGVAQCAKRVEKKEGPGQCGVASTILAAPA
jgi:hypothetical protein